MHTHMHTLLCTCTQAAGYAVPSLNAPLNIDRDAYDEVIHKAEEFIVRRFLSKFPQVTRKLMNRVAPGNTRLNKNRHTTGGCKPGACFCLQ